MKILAFDLAMTRTGWAFRGDTGTTLHGSAGFPRRRGDHPGDRYLAFRRWVYAAIDRPRPDLVAYEEVKRHEGTHAGHLWGALEGILLAACAEKRIDVRPVGVNVWKLAVLGAGKGNARKDVVMAQMRARGHRPMNEDEGDALAILEWAWAQSKVNG